MDSAYKPPRIRALAKLLIMAGFFAYLLNAYLDNSNELGSLLQLAVSLALGFGGAGIGAFLVRECSGFPAPSWKLLAATVAGAGICGWLVLTVSRFLLSIVFKLGIIIGAIFCVIALGILAFSFASVSLANFQSDKKLAEQAIQEGGNAANISHLVNTDMRYSRLRSGDGKTAYDRERARHGMSDDR